MWARATTGETRRRAMEEAEDEDEDALLLLASPISELEMLLKSSEFGIPLVRADIPVGRFRTSPTCASFSEAAAVLPP